MDKLKRELGEAAGLSDEALADIAAHDQLLEESGILSCEDCGAPGDGYEWGDRERVFCRACAPAAYKRWKATEEESYP